MSYTNVPVNINEKFSVSQPKITENFSIINAVFAKDHEAFDSGDKGKHKQVTFPEQAISAGVYPVATSASELQIYCAPNTPIAPVVAGPALYIRRPGKAIGVATDDIDFTTADIALPGYCWLPCGLKMIWGSLTILGAHQSATGNFTNGGFPTNVLTVMIVKTNFVSGALGDDSIVLVTAKTKTQVTLSRAVAAHVGTTALMEYLAIGY